MHARPFRVALPLLPVWGVGRGREKRAGVMRVLGGGGAAVRATPPESRERDVPYSPGLREAYFAADKLIQPLASFSRELTSLTSRRQA
jgi:hypothetical protein